MKTCNLFVLGFLTVILMVECSNEKSHNKVIPGESETVDTTRAALPIQYFTSGYADVNGIRMYYETYGK